VVGAGWGAGAIVNTTLDKATEPQIVIDKNGNATVVWAQNGSIYASNGSLATPTPTPSPSPSSTPSPTPSPTSTPSGTGIVFGYVNDEDENYLEGVAVTIAGNGYSDSVNTDEDGYYEFFKNNNNTLEWLVSTASDVYDTAPTNVQAGLDYGCQETPQSHPRKTSDAFFLGDYGTRDYDPRRNDSPKSRESRDYPGFHDRRDD